MQNYINPAKRSSLPLKLEVLLLKHTSAVMSAVDAGSSEDLAKSRQRAVNDIMSLVDDLLGNVGKKDFYERKGDISVNS